MVKEMLTGLSLSLLVVGSALAHEAADGSKDADMPAESGSNAVPGPPVSDPDRKTPAVAKDMPIEYQFGVNVTGHHASGLQIYTVGWGVDLLKELIFSATGHWFAAGAVESGLSRNIGLETDFCLTYTVSENYALLLAYDHFFTGPFFRGASGSGDDIHYGYAMLQFNLEKSKLKAPKI